MTDRELLDDRLYDIGIVGGGPAGLSAAIWSARYGHSVVLVDSGDPRNWETRGVNGYLGLPGVRPAELRGKGRDELRKYDVTLVDAAVLRVEHHDEMEDALVFQIEGGARAYARRVLLAIGMRDVWPDIPGLDKVYGANAHVCPDCDGYDAQDKKVVVIGHGRRAVAMALALTTWTNDITIATNGVAPDFDDEDLSEKIDACSIRVVPESIIRVDCSGRNISCLALEGGNSLEADKVFFTLAQYPADDLGAQLGCERDRGGHIVVSEHYATSVDSVFAAGDITPGPQLAVRAASAGAVAGMSMHRSLVPEHRKLEARH
jgi:thioredoxin reductase